MQKKIKAKLVTATILRMLAAIISIAPAAQAQTAWKPDRPVTLVVPYAAGGGTDATARAVARRLTDIWGQPVVVANQPGADGLLGTRRVIDAKPDGYTLLTQVPSIMLTKHQPNMKGIDPLERLAPVSNIAQAPAVLVVSSKLPVKNLAELVHYCMTLKEPACSSGGAENLSKIITRQFAAAHDLKSLVYIPYRGTSAVVIDAVAGNVTMGFVGLSATLLHYRSGTLRAIAVLGPQRSKAMPDVPTASEAGMKVTQIKHWFGLFAPKDVPKPVINAIARALHDSRNDEDIQKIISNSGSEVLMSTPDEFTKQLSEENEQMTALARQFPLD